MDYDLIFKYTRKQAIEDGVLVDITEPAKEKGFRVPVAVTSAVWHDFIVPPEAAIGQSIEGRLHDLLWMLLLKIKSGANGQIVFFDVIFTDKEGKQEQVKLKCISGAGDDGEHVLTIMLPNED